MLYCWGAMMAIVLFGLLLMKMKKLESTRSFLWVVVFSTIFPYVANTAGWFTAELGRQPWIVQGLMRTKQGVSPVVSRGDIIASLAMFTFVFGLLFVLFLFLLNRKIQHGPVEVSSKPEDVHYRDYLA
jgi:cytochrome d ubiquinol oxidase subunit I